MKITRSTKSNEDTRKVKLGDCFVCEDDVYIVVWVQAATYYLIGFKYGNRKNNTNIWDKTVAEVSDYFFGKVTYVPAEKTDELIEVIVSC